MDIKAIIRTIAGIVIKVALAILVVALILKLTQSAYSFGYRIFAEKPMTEGQGQVITIVVTESDTVRSVGVKLHDKGLIRDAKLFYFQEMFSNYHGMMQPGTYDLSTSMTVEEMLGIMAAGYEDEEEEEMTGNSESEPVSDYSGEEYYEEEYQGEGGEGGQVELPEDEDIELPEGE